MIDLLILSKEQVIILSFEKKTQLSNCHSYIPLGMQTELSQPVCFPQGADFEFCFSPHLEEPNLEWSICVWPLPFKSIRAPSRAEPQILMAHLHEKEGFASAQTETVQQL